MTKTQGEMPVRIQRKRTKGWRMPKNTVYVGRPSKWGNPFDIDKYGRGQSVLMFKNHVRFMCDEDIEELKGKNLACWCPLDQPCHADILLKIANEI